MQEYIIDYYLRFFFFSTTCQNVCLWCSVGWCIQTLLCISLFFWNTNLDQRMSSLLPFLTNIYVTIKEPLAIFNRVLFWNINEMKVFIISSTNNSMVFDWWIRLFFWYLFYHKYNKKSLWARDTIMGEKLDSRLILLRIFSRLPNVNNNRDYYSNRWRV